MNIISRLANNYFKQIIRKNYWMQGIIWYIVLGVSIVYAFIIAFYLNNTLEMIYPNQKSMDIINKYMLIYMLSLFVVYLLSQRALFSDIQVYLHLNIKKKNIIHYLLAKSILSPFILISLALFIPIGFISTSHLYSVFSSILWIIFLMLFLILINFVALYIKIITSKSGLMVLIKLSIISLLVLMIKYYLMGICNISKKIFSLPYHNPLIIIILVLLLVIIYKLNLNLLLPLCYLDNIYSLKQKEKNRKKYTWLENSGQTGRLIAVNIKQVFRNKRTKGMFVYFLFMAVFLGYFFGPYSLTVKGENGFFALLVAVAIWGGYMLSYAVLFLSWDSYQIDFILSSNVPIRLFIKAKIMTIVLLNLIIYFFTLILMIFYPVVCIMALCGFLLNAGLLIYISIIVSIYNVKKIDTNRSIFMNYEGQNIINYIYYSIVVIVPLILMYYIFDENLKKVFIIIGCVGLMGVIIHNKIIDVIYKIIKGRKYLISNILR